MTVSVEIPLDVFERGLERAQRWLNRQIADLPPIRNLRRLAEEMHANELILAELHTRLTAMKNAGIAQRSDYAVYETARANMHAMHLRFHGLLRRIFESYPEVLGQIPPVKWAPKVVPGPPVPVQMPAQAPVAGALGSGGGQTLRGALGNPAAAAGATAAGGAAAAAGLAPWMIAGIMVIILAAIVAVIAVVVTGALTEESVRDVAVTREQLTATRDMWAERERIYNDCRNAGGTPQACGSTAEAMVPTPPEVLRDLPRPGEWTKWVAIGLGFLVVGGLAFWGISALRGRRRRQRRLEGARTPRYRRMTPEQWLDGDELWDYGMEDT